MNTDNYLNKDPIKIIKEVISEIERTKIMNPYLDYEKADPIEIIKEVISEIERIKFEIDFQVKGLNTLLFALGELCKIDLKVDLKGEPDDR